MSFINPVLSSEFLVSSPNSKLETHDSRLFSETVDVLHWYIRVEPLRFPAVPLHLDAAAFEAHSDGAVEVESAQFPLREWKVANVLDGIGQEDFGLFRFRGRA